MRRAIYPLDEITEEVDTFDAKCERANAGGLRGGAGVQQSGWVISMCGTKET
jgi:hypothetical protein